MAKSKAVRGASRPITDLQFIHSLLDRPTREQTNLFWAEGCRNLHAAFEARREIHAVVVCPQLLRSRDTWHVVSALKNRGVPILRATADEFSAISTHAEPQGIGVVANQRWERLIDLQLTRDDMWVVLDNVRTPGNLGTILRTCAATGAQGIMLVGGETDPHDPAAIRASMGALFRQRLIRTSAKALAGWKSRHPCRIVGTAPSACTSYRSATYDGPLLIVMGNERSGLRDRQMALCDTVVSLPLQAGVDSLNLAVATGVVLYEAATQRSLTRPQRRNAATP